MKKYIYVLFLLLFPTLLFADSLSFTPPLSDYSVIFLGNLFGIVDGVLSGTGSQIMGQMFNVFNSAVLALGGIIIMYTLMVSTINTAHKGQMLGEKWSSVWVPIRSTLGLALLIPKSTGYCLIQIIVMWVVVQGVGAADKVWNAALDYLNRGGLIVQQQVDPLVAFKGDNQAIKKGASDMLIGQVCMLGLEKALSEQRERYLNQKEKAAESGNKDGGICSNSAPSYMKEFCSTPVPDFINSVNFVAIQSDATSGLASLSQPNGPARVRPQLLAAPMPNLPTTNPYHVLNGICGTIRWNLMSTSDISAIDSVMQSKSDLDITKQSRAIALDRMYSALSSTAQTMVDNNPVLMKNLNPDTPLFSKYAKTQFGVPYTLEGVPCIGTRVCVAWGPDASGSAPILTGDELQKAIENYIAIMQPTRRLINEATKDKDVNAKRQFIKKAEQSGWIMAGSYFIDLSKINTTRAGDKNITDTGTGLDQSEANLEDVLSGFKGTMGCNNLESPSSNKDLLCAWMQGNLAPIQAAIGLVDGQGLDAPIPGAGVLDHTIVRGARSATVNGYITNASNMTFQGQPGSQAPTFGLKVNFDLKPTFQLPRRDFPCGNVGGYCLGRILGNIFYNGLLLFVFNFILGVMFQIVKLILMAFLTLPLEGMAQIFLHGVSFIQQPWVNPVVALANMGTNYINFAMDMWIFLLQVAIINAIFPVLLPILAMVLPLLVVWLGTMVAIGFITAYYIPFLPYMIFTFGSIAWLMAVIEAMVAAPIVALGVTHPEGEGAFGKGEQAIMLLMNVFLRPAMMIIGYIAAIALSYVCIWIINAGFARIIVFIQGDPTQSGLHTVGTANDLFNPNDMFKNSAADDASNYNPACDDEGNWNSSCSTTGHQAGKGPMTPDQGGYNAEGKFHSYLEKNYGESDMGDGSRIDTTVGYTGWAGIYGFFYSILIYTTMYVTAVQKSFSLITMLPDKVLRWISGGQAESLGADTSQWTEETKGKVAESGKETAKAGGTIGDRMGDTVTKISPSKAGGGGGMKIQPGGGGGK